jgi:hypothetical protein
LVVAQSSSEIPEGLVNNPVVILIVISIIYNKWATPLYSTD